jgi:uncharacterized protein (TIGR02611 family)
VSEPARKDAGRNAGDATDEPHRHLLRDAADDDDWAWRRRLRANPTTKRVYQGVVFVLGLVLVVGGIILVPLPGPGWLIVIFGIAVWASEFEPADRLLDFVKARLKIWQDWLSDQPFWVKGAVGLATFACVSAAVWTVMKVGGVPGFVPDALATWLRANAGL